MRPPLASAEMRLGACAAHRSDFWLSRMLLAQRCQHTSELWATFGLNDGRLNQSFTSVIIALHNTLIKLLSWGVRGEEQLLGKSRFTLCEVRKIQSVKVPAKVFNTWAINHFQNSRYLLYFFQYSNTYINLWKCYVNMETFVFLCSFFFIARTHQYHAAESMETLALLTIDTCIIWCVIIIIPWLSVWLKCSKLN